MGNSYAIYGDVRRRSPTPARSTGRRDPARPRSTTSRSSIRAPSTCRPGRSTSRRSAPAPTPEPLPYRRARRCNSPIRRPTPSTGRSPERAPSTFSTKRDEHAEQHVLPRRPDHFRRNGQLQPGFGAEPRQPDDDGRDARRIGGHQHHRHRGLELRDPGRLAGPSRSPTGRRRHWTAPTSTVTRPDRQRRNDQLSCERLLLFPGRRLLHEPGDRRRGHPEQLLRLLRRREHADHQHRLGEANDELRYGLRSTNAKFINTSPGTVSVESGTLDISVPTAVTQTGTFTVAAGAILQFSGSGTDAISGAINGGGAVTFAGWRGHQSDRHLRHQRHDDHGRHGQLQPGLGPEPRKPHAERRDARRLGRHEHHEHGGLQLRHAGRLGRLHAGQRDHRGSGQLLHHDPAPLREPDHAGPRRGTPTSTSRAAPSTTRRPASWRSRTTRTASTAARPRTSPTRARSPARRAPATTQIYNLNITNTGTISVESGILSI